MIWVSQKTDIIIGTSEPRAGHRTILAPATVDMPGSSVEVQFCAERHSDLKSCKSFQT